MALRQLAVQILCRVSLFALFFVTGIAQASVWVNDDRSLPSQRGLDLISAVELADRQGFDTQSLRLELQNAQTDAQLDAAQNRVLKTLIGWFSKGQINPSVDPLWSYPVPQADIDAEYLKALRAPDLLKGLSSLLPSHPDYLALVDALGIEKKRAAEPAAVNFKGLIRLGDSAPAIEQIRKRLEWLGYLQQDETTRLAPRLFDQALDVALKQFQKTHGLEADGIAGPDTLSGLNQSQDERIAQIRVALERWRWLPRNLGPEYLMVLTPGFEVRLVGPDNQVLERYKSISGRKTRPSNSFAAQVEQLVVNPDWTVPVRIMVRDLIPKIINDPEYLSRQQIAVQIWQDGHWQAVDSAQINWSDLSASGQSVRLVQSPGPGNALGQLKFYMPNPYAIYLHDTPHKELFDEAQRAFSSGCIRVQNVSALARSILGTRADQLVPLLSDTKTQWLRLPKPLPVYLIYMRTWVDESGGLQMRDDIYDIDRLVAQRLNQGSLTTAARR